MAHGKPATLPWISRSLSILAKSRAGKRSPQRSKSAPRGFRKICEPEKWNSLGIMVGIRVGIGRHIGQKNRGALPVQAAFQTSNVTCTPCRSALTASTYSLFQPSNQYPPPKCRREKRNDGARPCRRIRGPTHLDSKKMKMPHAAKGGIGRSDESVHGPYACHPVENTYKTR